ncbi:MAG: hypothetical protein AB1689_16810 [Thermodesulfobacteriota bacterium]
MRRQTAVVLAAAMLLGAGTALAEQHQEKAAGKEMSCDQIQAAMDETGGGTSVDMLSKKLNVPVERINACLKKEAMEQEKQDNPAK